MRQIITIIHSAYRPQPCERLSISTKAVVVGDADFPRAVDLILGFSLNFKEAIQGFGHVLRIGVSTVGGTHRTKNYL